MLPGYFDNGQSAEFEHWLDRTGATIRAQAARCAWKRAEEEEAGGNGTGAIVGYLGEPFAETTIVNGQIVVQGGRVVGVDEDAQREQANHLSRALLEAAGQPTTWM